MAVADYSAREHKGFDFDAFAFRVKHFLLSHSEILLGSAQTDGHIVTPKTQGGSGAIEDGKAGANYEDPRAHDGRAAGCDLNHEVQTGMDPRESLSGDLQFKGFVTPCGQKDGIVVGQNIIHSQILTDSDPRFQGNTQPEDAINFSFKNISWEPEFRDAVPEHPSGLLKGLKKGHRDTDGG